MRASPLIWSQREKRLSERHRGGSGVTSRPWEALTPEQMEADLKQQQQVGAGLWTSEGRAQGLGGGGDQEMRGQGRDRQGQVDVVRVPRELEGGEAERGVTQEGSRSGAGLQG